MSKLPECDRCLYCARDYHLVCAVHPVGPPGNTCSDFALDPELEGKQFQDFPSCKIFGDNPVNYGR